MGKRVWKDYVESEAVEAVEEQEKKEMDSERKVTLTEVYVSEVTDEGKFYACNVADGPALETLMEGLRTEFATSPPLAGAYTPKKGDLCAAKFVDDQWYRARVEKMSANEVAVLSFIALRWSAYLRMKSLQPKECWFSATTSW